MIEVDEFLNAVVDILSSDSIVRKYIGHVGVCMGEQVRGKDIICVTAGSISNGEGVIGHDRYNVTVNISIFVRGLNTGANMRVFNPLIGRIYHLLYNNQKLGGLALRIAGSSVDPVFRPEEDSEMYVAVLSVIYDVID